jgi:hypothetical protein
MSAYQCFGQTVELFDKIRNSDQDAKLLVLTPAQEAAKPYLKGLPKGCWQMSSASLDEVNGYLNAADGAFMLREDDPLNKVASPTKFAEYALSGLPVVMTGAVVDTARIAREIGNFISKEEAYQADIDSFNRLQIAQGAASVLSREAILEKYADLYQLFKLI